MGRSYAFARGVIALRLRRRTGSAYPREMTTAGLAEPTPRAIQARFPALTARLGDAELPAFAAALKPQELAAGQALLVQGNGSESLYLVWDGELVVTVEADGKDAEVGRLAPGEMVGEESLLDPGPASATVTAAKPSRVLRLSRASLEDLVRSHARPATSVLHALSAAIAARIGAADGKLEQLNAPGLETSASAVRDNTPGPIDMLRALFGLKG
jgi:CRP/FNR family transcriptional regulator, cyclic AMP receptor protein